MSKKMLKRSLALGALMAFVITGQAWAAEEKAVVVTNNTSLRNQDNYHFLVSNSDVVELGDVDLIVTGNGMTFSGVTKSDGSTQSGEAVNENPNVNLHATNLKMSTGNDNNGIQLHYGAKLDLDVDNKLSITATGHGINTGGAMDGKVDITAGDVTINAGENALYTYRDVTSVKDKENSIVINAEDVTLTSAYTGNDEYKGYAVMAASQNSTIDIKATGKIDLDGVNGGIKAIDGSTVNVIGSTVEIDATSENANGNLTAVKAESYKGVTSIVIGSENSVVKVSASDKAKEAQGIWARNREGNKAEITVNGQSLNVTVTGVSNNGFAPIGVWAASGTDGKNSNTETSKQAAIIIDTANTNINVIDANNKEAIGIAAHSQGKVDITQGNVYVTAIKAIEVRGKATANVGAVGKETQLNGDIFFGYADNSGTEVDANVNLILDGNNSWLKGNIEKSIVPENRVGVVTGMNLSLSNGAQWELSKASLVNNATFGKDSVLILKEGSTFEKQPDATKNVYALNADGGDANKLTVAQGAKLQIGGIKETTYNLATGFTSYDVAETLEIADNALLQANKILEGNNYQVEVKAKDAKQMAADTGISTSTAELVQSIIEGADNEDKTPAQEAAVEFIENVIANNPTDAAVGNAINAATKMGEAGGNSATAASIVKNVTGVTNDRLSFNCGHSAPHKGGHGVGLFEEGSGADVWVEYVHGKDEVEDMPSTAGASSYEGQYNGIVMGVDFKKVNKFQSGIAFNYGEGDTNSVGNAVRTHSDYDFWGVGYYGSIHNDDSNVIFDINYAQTDSDVTQYNSGSVIEASPETTTWSAGVKLEKLYQNENVQIVPYTGLRYMSIDADDYSTKKGEFYYSMDRQDIWLLPLGVSIKQEVTNDNGWTVSPRVDLSYIWAFGDTNSNMEVKSPFAGVSQLGYDVMDDGSFLGLVGIEAHKGQWGYGIAYSYQKGDHSESKKWFVDVNYSF